MHLPGLSITVHPAKVLMHSRALRKANYQFAIPHAAQSLSDEFEVPIDLDAARFRGSVNGRRFDCAPASTTLWIYGAQSMVMKPRLFPDVAELAEALGLTLPSDNAPSFYMLASFDDSLKPLLGNSTLQKVVVITRTLDEDYAIAVEALAAQHTLLGLLLGQIAPPTHPHLDHHSV